MYWPDEAIALLVAGGVDEISLDHDLGDDERGIKWSWAFKALRSMVKKMIEFYMVLKKLQRRESP